MAEMTRSVLITGATGKQGGAIAGELLAKGWRVRAMTRKPEGEAAKALARRGAEVVKGDLDDEASLERALTGVWGAFAVQNTWEAGVQREEEQGLRFAEVARRVGLPHLVYSSVGSAHRRTGIPHFENKWRIEERIRALKFPSYVIIRPVFFMENLPSPWFLQGDRIVSTLSPETRLQMIAVEDIGRFGAMAFERAEELNGQAIDIAGDSATMPQTAALFTEVLGRRIEYQRIPLEEVRKNSSDFAAMLEWFDRTGYDVDIPALEKRFGIRPLRLAEWAHRHLRG